MGFETADFVLNTSACMELEIRNYFALSKKVNVVSCLLRFLAKFFRS